MREKIPNPYTDQLHARCMDWAEFITSPNRTLVHRAALARFIRGVDPGIAHQVEMLIQIKLNIELLAKGTR